MPKSKAASELRKIRPTVEHLETREAPGNFLMGATGISDPMFGMNPARLSVLQPAPMAGRSGSSWNQIADNSNWAPHFANVTTPAQPAAGYTMDTVSVNRDGSTSSQGLGYDPIQNQNTQNLINAVATAGGYSNTSSGGFGNGTAGVANTDYTGSGTNGKGTNIAGDPEALAQLTAALMVSPGGGGGGVGGGGGGGSNVLATNKWMVTVVPGVNVQQIAAYIGAQHLRSTYIANQYVWAFPSSLSEAQVISRLNSVSGAVKDYYRMYNIDSQQVMFIPNDPLFPQQWHLRNTGQGGGMVGIDANVINAWNTVRGTGVKIGIVDDGVDWTHPDLQPNFNFLDSADFTDEGTPYGLPSAGASHGSSVSGVAGARGNNLAGVSGAAPNASIASMKIFGGAIGDLGLADAVTWHNQSIMISNNSWAFTSPGVTDKVVPQLNAAIQNAVRSGRGGKGEVILFASGNSGEVDANYFHPGNNVNVITVGAMANTGRRADFSQYGSNLFVVAPSNGGTLGITTTASRGTGDLLNGDYTSGFGGTSSATPLVSGVVALMLQANPNLGYRDVMNILARTSRKVDPSNFNWTTNAVGLNINPEYGFGMVDAFAAVNMASTYTDYFSTQVMMSTSDYVGQRIIDANPIGITRSINMNLPTNFVVEKVAVRMDLDGPVTGDFDIRLTSPSGTESQLIRPLPVEDNISYPDPLLPTVRNWGESGNGTWTLSIKDARPGFEATFNSWTL